MAGWAVQSRIFPNLTTLCTIAVFVDLPAGSLNIGHANVEEEGEEGGDEGVGPWAPPPGPPNDT
jgi:hypothetical protein